MEALVLTRSYSALSASGKIAKYVAAMEELRELERDPVIAAMIIAEGLREGWTRLDRVTINRILQQLGREVFDARTVATRVPGVTIKQVNDHLRRLANAGRIERVAAGRRGRRGGLPQYINAVSADVARSPLPAAIVRAAGCLCFPLFAIADFRGQANGEDLYDSSVQWRVEVHDPRCPEALADKIELLAR